MEKEKESPEELTEIVRAIEVEQESLDYKVMEAEVEDVDKNSVVNNYNNIFEAEQESLPYSKVFSYSENSTKENPYTTYESAEKKVEEEVEVKKYDMDYEEVHDYVKMSKIANLFNQDIKFSTNYKTREKFETFKLFNKGFVEMVYDLV